MEISTQASEYAHMQTEAHLISINTMGNCVSVSAYVDTNF